MPKNISFRSDCPLASALDLLGDKWTLLIIRDLAQGKETYTELEHSDENITTNILADRLKRLVVFDLVKKELYQTRPNRYRYLLTQKGKSLIPVLMELVKWGEKHLGSLCDQRSELPTG